MPGKILVALVAQQMTIASVMAIMWVELSIQVVAAVTVVYLIFLAIKALKII